MMIDRPYHDTYPYRVIPTSIDDVDHTIQLIFVRSMVLHKRFETCHVFMLFVSKGFDIRCKSYVVVDVVVVDDDDDDDLLHDAHSKIDTVRFTRSASSPKYLRFMVCVCVCTWILNENGLTDHHAKVSYTTNKSQIHIHLHVANISFVCILPDSDLSRSVPAFER